MKTALLLLDFINDIVDDKGKIAAAAAQVAARGTIASANHALAQARAQNWLIVLVKVGFAAGYREQPKQSPMFGKAHQIQALQLGEWGTEFHRDLEIQSNDLVIAKPRVSAFYGTALDASLRGAGIARVCIGGVSSAWAVQASARDAHDRDYAVVVIEDACAAAETADHEASMKQLARIAKIVSVKQLGSLD